MTRFALHVLFSLSGLAALAYQLLWAKMFSTGLGHEMPAVLAIIAAFMAGMALGAALIDRFIPRDARAGLWLGGLELTIGLWAAIASFAIPHANELSLRLIGLAPNPGWQWIVSFAIPALVLLPATTAMGATLPAMEKLLSGVAPANESIGSVYAANTFGAVAGTLLTPFLLMPLLGFSKAGWVLAAVNLLAGCGALAFGRLQAKPENPAHTKQRVLTPLSSRRLTVILFITGLLGITYEVAGLRVLSQVLPGTVFTYAAVLAIFLLGTAAGAAAFHRWWRQHDEKQSLPLLLYASGMACMLGLFALMLSGWIYENGRALGDGLLAVLAAEMITASAVFALPTFFMGALFSRLTQSARTALGGIGRVLAANTFGAALAPFVVVALLPMVGAKWVLFATAFGYFIINLPARPPRFGIFFALSFFLAVALGYSARLRWVEMPPGGKILFHREGVMASVAVVEDAEKHRTLRVDNRFQMGGTAGADAEYRQAHIPLLLHRAPTNALFLGLGTGISFGAAVLHSNVKADGVELVPEVVEVMPAFAPANFSAEQNSRLRIHVADARRFVRASETEYDVIVADLFHPYRDGAGALYTREHFTAIRARLNTNGLFCQWLPLHQLDEATLRVITRTFLEVFPDGEAWLLRMNVDVPVIGLVGRNRTQIYSGNWIESRLRDPQLVGALKRLSLGDSVRFFGSFVAGPEDLRRLSERAVLNTDDNQRVTFIAPRLSYQRNAKPYASLFSLLGARPEKAKLALRLPVEEAAFASRVESYISARDVYLRGLALYSEGQREEAINHYIESAQLSEEFTAGYAQCLSIATVLAGSDPNRAKAILERLMEAQPSRPAARELLLRLALP